MIAKPDHKAGKDLVIVFSLVNLCFLRVWRELIHAVPSDHYYLPTYTTTDYVAVLINVVLISLCLWLVACLVRKGNHWVDTVARLGFLAVLILPLNYLRMALGIKYRALYWLFANPWLGMAIALIVGLGSLFLLFFKLRLLSRVFAVLLFVFSPYLLLTSGQALVNILTMPPTELSDSIDAVDLAGKPANPRLFLMVFDELDLRLTFLERPQWIELPNFDRLRAESLFAIDAHSHWKDTMEAIPSLTSGHLVRSATPRDAVKLELFFDGDKDAHSVATWTEMESIFSVVANRSDQVAVTGLYHPYCRIFREHLSYCRQFMSEAYTPRVDPSLLWTMVSQLRGITPIASRLNALDTYNEILRNAIRTATEPSYSLIYVHVPVPHWPEIFDPKSQSFSLSLFVSGTTFGYFGNLLLADRFLGQIRQSMERSRLWDSTTIILTSDHEWRRSEDFDGVRIDKIPFMVRLANTQHGMEYPHEFSPLTVSKPLIEAILSGQVSTLPELLHWMDDNANN